MLMNRSVIFGLVLLSFECGMHANSAGLAIGELAGTVNMVSPEHLPVAMNNYGERRATVVLFLSARDPSTEAAAEAIVALNEKHRHHRILFVGVFPDPAQTGAEVRAYCQARGFNFPVYLDPREETVKHFGARVTPQAFLMDQQGKLVYRGALAGLSPALLSLEANAPIPNAETEPVGTSIGKALPKQTIAYPFGSIEFSSELVFEKIPGYPVHHCSTIAD